MTNKEILQLFHESFKLVDFGDEGTDKRLIAIKPVNQDDSGDILSIVKIAKKQSVQSSIT